MDLDENVKTELIRNDPVMCARYFDHKCNAFMKLIKSKNSIFGKYFIVDSYERVESQKRGSPHEHIMVWAHGAPVLDLDNIQESEKKCIEFVNEFITCKNDLTIPIIGVQNHRHTHTCYKQKGQKRKCRFGFPHPVMNETRILHPLYENEEIHRENGMKNYDKIKMRMNELFKKPQEITFNDILGELKLSENEYIFAIRCTLKVSKVYLQRGSMDVGINAYNKDILNIFESNMDIQFILNEFAVAAYIVNYISKVDSGLTKLLRQAVADTQYWA